MFAFNTVEELFMKQSALLLPRPASYCPGLQDQESHGPETADHYSTTNFSPNAPRSCCAVIVPLMWSVNDPFGQTKFRCVVQTNDSEIATQSKNQRILTEKSRQGIKEKTWERNSHSQGPWQTRELFRIGCVCWAYKEIYFWRLRGNYVDL